MIPPTALPLPASAVNLRAAGCLRGAGRALFLLPRKSGCNPARDCTDTIRKLLDKLP